MNQISSLITSESYDIVHVNTPYNFQPAKTANDLDAALVWHFNDVLTPWPINRIAGHFANRWADAIAVSSKKAIEYFHLDSSRSTVLYPPIDLSEFDPNHYSDGSYTFEKNIKINSNTLVIGSIGNINPIKGYDILIDSIDRVDNEFESIVLLIAGAQLESQQQYFKKLESMIDSKCLDQQIHFLGWVSDIPQFLSELDLFVVPSLSETGPLVALEAMAMECPIVSTRVGAVAEQAVDGKHGWIVDPGDSEALAACLIEALSSPCERSQRAKAGRKLVKQKFSLEKASKKHIQLYNSITD